MSLVVCLMSLVALPGNALAGEADSHHERTLSPFFVVEGMKPGVDGFPLLATSVKVNAVGVIAAVTVTQVYKNEGASPINARYVFPASTRAAVHGLSMKLRDRLIRATIREREKAKAEFETAKKEGKAATLLEQDRPNVFTMNVANILPGDRIEVTLEYTELLVPEEGTYEFVFPTVVGPRYSHTPAANATSSDAFVRSPYLRPGQAPSFRLNIQGQVSAGFPIANISVPTHQVNVKHESPTTVSFLLDPSEQSSGNRDFILHYRLAHDVIQSGLSVYEKEGEKYFLGMVQAPKRVTPEAIPAREFVFVVDVSGSMFGFPLDTARTLLVDLVSKLKTSDTFNILFFSGDNQLLAPQSLPATPENLRRATALLKNVEGRGGTELLPALQRALALPSDPERSRSFVVITDGYISSEAEVFDYIRSNLAKANVYSFGIGSSVNRFLVEGVARAGLGVPFVVTEAGQATQVAQRFRKYIEAPALTHVRVRFEGFDAYDVEPQSLPDVLEDRPVVVQGKWRGEAKGALVITGTSGAGPYSARLEMQAATRGEENSALPYLWARSRISALSDWHADDLPASHRKEVLLLGLKYNLLTRYTSFIAISEQVQNHAAPATDVSQPLPLPLGVSERAVGDDIMGADEPELVLLISMLMLALGAITWVRYSRPGVRA